MFDNKRLEYMNSYYIKALDENSYKEKVYPFIKEFKSNEFSKERLKEISLYFKNEITKLSDVKIMLNDLLHPIYEFDEESKEMLQKESSNVVCSLFKEKLAKLEKIDEISIKSLFKEIQKETSIKGKDLYMPIRLKITGKNHGLEMYHIIEILGRDLVLSRL